MLAITAIIAVILLYKDTGSAWHNQYDDAYITYRYAVNLAEHWALEFSLGERTDAASSFLYTVTLAAFYRLGWHDVESVSFLLNMLALGTITAFVYLCAFRLSRNHWGSVALGLIASTHGFISGWACMGLETIFFTALLCTLTWAVIECRNTLSLILTAAVVLMRPEGILLVPFCWWATERKMKYAVIVAGFILVYYGARFSYYHTLIPDSLALKQIMIYYQPNAIQTILGWKSFALAAPVIMIIGGCIEPRARWLLAYIVVAFIVCLAGPRADFYRYSAHLFPLMLIAGAPLFRNWNGIRLCILCPFVLLILIFQGYQSVLFYRYQAANLAPVQEARLRAGQWLQENCDKSRWVLSGDIGAISYAAKDVKFIDTIGLCSRDVLEAYQRGENIDKILEAKKPLYIADTFEVRDGKIQYTHLNAGFIRNGKPSKAKMQVSQVQGYEPAIWLDRPYAIMLLKVEEP